MDKPSPSCFSLTMIVNSKSIIRQNCRNHCLKKRTSEFILIETRKFQFPKVNREINIGCFRCLLSTISCIFVRKDINNQNERDLGSHQNLLHTRTYLLDTFAYLSSMMFSSYNSLCLNSSINNNIFFFFSSLLFQPLLVNCLPLIRKLSWRERKNKRKKNHTCLLLICFTLDYQ